MNVHEDKIARNMFMSILKSSPIIDKISTWFLAGLGATSALIIANIKDILIVLHQETIGLVLYLLISAMLFGFIQKYLATRIGIFVSVTEYNQGIMKEPLPNGEKLDFSNVLPHILETVPWYQKNYIAKLFIKTAEDQYYGYKNSVRMYNRQVAHAYFQFIFTILAILITAININSI